MAMRRRSNRGRRFGRRGGRPVTKWTANITDESAVAAGAFLATALVTPQDYFTAVTIQPKATCVRIVGSLSIILDSGTAASVGACMCGILVCDQDIALTDASLDPSTFQNLIDERWLWTGAHAMGPQTGLAHWDLDIKVAAALKDEDIRLVVANTSAPVLGLFQTSLFRSLLIGP